MRLSEALRALVEAFVGQRLDYQALYPCTVVAQDGLGRLDLLPDDAKIRGTGFQGVPILSGLPGFESTVDPGARVLLGFQGGDPQRPFASLWEPVTAANTVYNGGDEHVARTGDSAGELVVDDKAFGASVLAMSCANTPFLWYRSPRGTGAWFPVAVELVAVTPLTIGTPIIIDEGCPEFHA